MTTRLGLSVILFATCIGVAACGGSSESTPSPTKAASPASSTPQQSAVSSLTPAPGIQSYPGAVVGTYRTVGGATYVTESGTGIYYVVTGITNTTPLAAVLFVIGSVTPVPGLHRILATQIISVPESGGVGCYGTLARRDDRYFVESSAVGGCGSVELIEGDPGSLDTQLGQETRLTVRYCTVTKEGRMVKANLDTAFPCSSPYP